MLPLLSKLLPGPVTVLLRRRTALNSELNPTRESVGVRVPGDRLVRRLAQCCGEPLALTSANVSGERSTLAPKVGQLVKFIGPFQCIEKARLHLSPNKTLLTKQWYMTLYVGIISNLLT